MALLRFVPLLIAFLLGCGSSPPDGSNPPDDDLPDAGGMPTPDDGGGSPAEASFDTLGGWLDTKVEEGVMNGYALMIFGPDDTLLFEASAGTCEARGLCPPGAQPFTPDLVTGIASSSKWVSSTVVLAFLEDAVEDGVVADLETGLDRPLGEWLTCPTPVDPKVSGITLRHLLSFTSGLPTEYTDCSLDEDIATCTCRFLEHAAGRRVDDPTSGHPVRDSHPPGSVYKYSQTDLTVAMAIVEQNLGEPWRDYYQRRVAGPAGMESAAYSHHLQPAYGLRSSVRDYASFVRTIFHDGRGAGVVLSEEAVRTQQADQVREGVVVRLTPQEGLDYGLNNWRWCHGPVTANLLNDASEVTLDPSCSQVHQTGHGGKGGYVPWIDLGRGFYGVFAMREDRASADPADYTPEELTITALVRLYAGVAFEERYGTAE